MEHLQEADTLVTQVARSLTAVLQQRGIDNPALVGIHTGGLWIAERLHRLLAVQIPLGSLDIAFYRDDFSRIGMNPKVKPSKLPFPVDDQEIILVDDVLYTGRTVRAALNEIFDYGRPASVILVALVDRGGRELPIAPDVTGQRLELPPHRQVKLIGPDPLTLELQEVS